MRKKRMSNERTPVNKRIANNLRKPESETKIIRIDESDHEWLKETAYIDRTTMKDLVSKVIEYYKNNN